MPVEGQVVGGKYRLERFLGSGGFASVWAACNVDIDRHVALKILSDTFSTNPDFVKRFVREAKLSARPIHEAIIRVEDIGRTEEGAPFLVMELLEGETLSAVLKARSPLPVTECLELGRPLLEGLAAAHRLGIIHRDIKPANVFLTREGSLGARVRILDLGLGKDLGDETALTHTGQMMGTPDYMAPELLLSDQLASSSPSSDVFALGVLFFEMLTGRRPLSGIVQPNSRTSGFVERALFYKGGGCLPRVTSIRNDVPPKVDDMVARALAVDVGKRFRDASEMLASLEATPETMAAPVSLVDPPSKPGVDLVPTVAAPPDSAVSGVAVVSGAAPLADAVGAEGGVIAQDAVPTAWEESGAGQLTAATVAASEMVGGSSSSPALHPAVTPPTALAPASAPAPAAPASLPIGEGNIETAVTNPMSRPPAGVAANPVRSLPLDRPGTGPEWGKGGEEEIPATVATDSATYSPEPPPRRRRGLALVLVTIAVILTAVIGSGAVVLYRNSRLGPSAASPAPMSPAAAPETPSAPPPPETVEAAVAPVPPPADVPGSPSPATTPDASVAQADSGGPDGSVAEEPPPPRRRPTKRGKRPARPAEPLIPFDRLGREGRRQPAPPPIPFGRLGEQ